MPTTGREIAAVLHCGPGQKVVLDAYARFNGRPVRSYIPLFTERDAKAPLAGLTS